MTEISHSYKLVIPTLLNFILNIQSKIKFQPLAQNCWSAYIKYNLAVDFNKARIYPFTKKNLQLVYTGLPSKESLNQALGLP